MQASINTAPASATSTSFGDRLRPEDILGDKAPSDESRRSSTNSADSSGRQSVANNVVNSLLSGAAAVGSYVWNFWNSPSLDPAPSLLHDGERTRQDHCSVMPESQHYKHSKSNASEIVDSFRASGRSSIVGHKRAASNPEKLTQAAYLDDSEYGIRLVGRTSSEEEALLTTSMISKIHAGLPSRFRLCTKWKLIYSTPEHGFSLGTLFFQCKGHDGPTLIVIRDDGDAIFGVFATETWQPHLGHYGTGECFLWRVESVDNDRHGSASRIRKYGSTGKNAYFMISERNYLAAGCGDGQFGLWLDEELLNGQSTAVPTFDNDCLASAEHFKCINLEVWGLDMTPLE